MTADAHRRALVTDGIATPLHAERGLYHRSDVAARAERSLRLRSQGVEALGQVIQG